MAHIADHLDADPVAVRSINFLKAYPFPVPSIGAASCATTSSGSGTSQADTEATTQRVPGGCGRLNGWNAVAQPRMMSTSLGRCAGCHLLDKDCASASSGGIGNAGKIGKDLTWECSQKGILCLGAQGV